MDSYLWISRLASAKRHLWLQLQQNSRSDELEVEEEVGQDFPCPYFHGDHDIASLCSQLEEENPFESKVARCRSPGSRTIPSSQTLSLLRRDLREAHLRLLLGNGAYTSSNNPLNIAADSFLSSVILDFPTLEAEKNSKFSISTTNDSCSKKESA